MNKKLMLIGGVCLSLFFLGLFNEKEEPAQKIDNTSTISKQVKEQSTVKEDETDKYFVETECRKVAEQFVKAKNEGKSNEIYTERIDPIKHLLSDELYHSVVPQLSEEEIEKMKKESERIPENELTKTTITSIESASRKLEENDYEVYVLYTTNTIFPETANTSRYLMRMKVQWIDNNPKIYKIIEDSLVADGLYQ